MDCFILAIFSFVLSEGSGLGTPVFHDIHLVTSVPQYGRTPFDVANADDVAKLLDSVR